MNRDKYSRQTAIYGLKIQDESKVGHTKIILERTKLELYRKCLPTVKLQWVITIVIEAKKNNHALDIDYEQHNNNNKWRLDINWRHLVSFFLPMVMQQQWVVLARLSISDCRVDGLSKILHIFHDSVFTN